MSDERFLVAVGALSIVTALILTALGHRARGDVKDADALAYFFALVFLVVAFMCTIPWWDDVAR